MDIKEMQGLRSVTEKVIADALNNFCTMTGVSIYNVAVGEHGNMTESSSSKRSSHVVKIEVRL